MTEDERIVAQAKRKLLGRVIVRAETREHILHMEVPENVSDMIKRELEVAEDLSLLKAKDFFHGQQITSMVINKFKNPWCGATAFVQIFP